jgi:hypothetical protein
MPDDDSVPGAAFIQANAVFASMIGFALSEMIERNVTTKDRVSQRLAFLLAELNREGASMGAVNLVAVIGNMAFDEPPPGQP